MPLGRMNSKGWCLANFRLRRKDSERCKHVEESDSTNRFILPSINPFHLERIGNTLDNRNPLWHKPSRTRSYRLRRRTMFMVPSSTAHNRPFPSVEFAFDGTMGATLLAPLDAPPLPLLNLDLSRYIQFREETALALDAQHLTGCTVDDQPSHHGSICNFRPAGS